MTNYNPDNWVVIKMNGDDPHYRVTKLVNSKRLNLLEQDYEEDELKQMLNSLPATFDYQINNTIERKGKR